MMRVGQRLFLAVLPAVLGVFTVAGLTYWGERSRQAPEWVIVVAVIAAVASLLVAWRNTRHVAHRIEQLVSRRGTFGLTSGPLQRAVIALGDAAGLPATNEGSVSQDELETIEHVIDRLLSAVTKANAERLSEREEWEQRLREYGSLVMASANAAIRQLEGVRLPLHILLDNHFGELNENQEEMLGAARSATEDADEAILRLRAVVELDFGSATLRHDDMRISDVLASLVPALRMDAEEREVRLTVEIGPALPPITGDRGRLQKTLASILGGALGDTPPGGVMHVSVESDATSIVISIRGGYAKPSPRDLALEHRVMRAHGGTMEVVEGAIVMRLPRRRDV